MELEIKSDVENHLFNRREIQLNVKVEVTPSHENVKKLISEKFSIPAENIKIKKIFGKFGSKIFIITANIYASEEDKNKTESKSKKKAEKKAEEQPKTIVKEQPSQKEDFSLTSSNKSSELASEQSKE